MGEHSFEVQEKRAVEAGWTKYAARETPQTGMAPPLDLREGELLLLSDVAIQEKFSAPPVRYNQSTLLGKMEKEGIGTKSTRADIIATLLRRAYVTGRVALSPTDLGFSLVENLQRFCPQIISTELTRDVEAQLERVEVSAEDGRYFFERTVSELIDQISQVKRHGNNVSVGMRRSFPESSPLLALGPCPVCKDGELRVVRSRKSGKRFVGCTRYSEGCRASAPLPQRGAIRATPKPCSGCGWPVVYVKFGRRPWRLCVNDRCPRKVNVYKMQNLQTK